MFIEGLDDFTKVSVHSVEDMSRMLRKPFGSFSALANALKEKKGVVHYSAKQAFGAECKGQFACSCIRGVIFFWEESETVVGFKSTRVGLSQRSIVLDLSGTVAKNFIFIASIWSYSYTFNFCGLLLLVDISIQ
jgi:hypothetical protein